MPVNEALEAELAPLGTLRAYLVANPSTRWVAARPGQQTPPDPMLATVDRLLAALNQAIAITENKANVPALARLMTNAKKEADSLADAGLATITIAKGGSGKPFSGIHERINLAFQWYDRLAFYLTPEGKAYLKGVVEVRSEGEGESLKVHVFEHQFSENINPLPYQSWQYLIWAEEIIKQNEDPLDHIVDKLLRMSPNELHLWTNRSRLAATEDLRGSILVRVRTHVTGGDQYPAAGGPPRMWTFQVKTKTPLSTVDWNTLINASHAIGLPTLRVVNSQEIRGRGVGSDFIKGTLYAMDGPSHMYCYPPVVYHSALLSGDPITAAGILVAENGRVLAVDNRSGHYQPGYMQLKFAVEYLRTNQLFEPEAFVSLYLDNSDAIYFSPEDFIAMAGAGMPYSLVAQRALARAKKYQGLPMQAEYHERLLPPQLKFPADAKGRGERWDRMLLKLYSSPGANLKGVVDELNTLLKTQSQTPWQKGGANPLSGSAPAKSQAQPWQAAGPGGISVGDIQKRLAGGGAYCELIPIIDGLFHHLEATFRGQPQVRKIVAPYEAIQTKLFNMRPAQTILTG